MRSSQITLMLYLVAHSAAAAPTSCTNDDTCTSPNSDRNTLLQTKVSAAPSQACNDGTPTNGGKTCLQLLHWCGECGGACPSQAQNPYRNQDQRYGYDAQTNCRKTCGYCTTTPTTTAPTTAREGATTTAPTTASTSEAQATCDQISTACGGDTPVNKGASVKCSGNAATCDETTCCEACGLVSDNIVGNVLAGFPVIVDTACECQARCDAHSGCGAWTWASSNKKCWLRSAYGRINPGCDVCRSGKKKAACQDNSQRFDSQAQMESNGWHFTTTGWQGIYGGSEMTGGRPWHDVGSMWISIQHSGTLTMTVFNNHKNADTVDNCVNVYRNNVVLPDGSLCGVAAGDVAVQKTLSISVVTGDVIKIDEKLGIIGLRKFDFVCQANSGLQWVAYSTGHLSTGLTYIDAVEECQLREGLLCTKAQYCPNGVLSTSIAGDAAPTSTTGEVWVPYRGDTDNGWLQIGTNHTKCTKYIAVHGEPPKWGTETGWGPHVVPGATTGMCCALPA